MNPKTRAQLSTAQQSMQLESGPSTTTFNDAIAALGLGFGPFEGRRGTPDLSLQVPERWMRFAGSTLEHECDQTRAWSILELSLTKRRVLPQFAQVFLLGNCWFCSIGNRRDYCGAFWWNLDGDWRM
jgi:hypothetical protein